MDRQVRWSIRVPCSGPGGPGDQAGVMRPEGCLELRCRALAMDGRTAPVSARSIDLTGTDYTCSGSAEPRSRPADEGPRRSSSEVAFMGIAVPEHAVVRRATRLLILIAICLFLGACSDGRYRAASELQRLDDAMRQHATRYGSFPETIDPALPPSRANLPYVPERKVRVRLIGATSESYAATARRGVWLCAVRVGPGQRADPDCTPTGSESSESADGAQPAAPLEGILEEPGAPVDSV